MELLDYWRGDDRAWGERAMMQAAAVEWGNGNDAGRAPRRHGTWSIRRVGRPTLERVVLAAGFAGLGSWSDAGSGATVQVRENHDPLVDPREFDSGIAVAVDHPWNPYPRSPLVREGVARRLAAAQRALPEGHRLQILEGYRRPVVQRKLLRLAYEQVRQEHPRWSEREVTVVAAAWAGGPLAALPAPHPTGGAVDVTLLGPGGEPLDLNGPRGWCAATAPTVSPVIPDEACDHRQVLVFALAGAGLVNDPAEWWHWSFGDPAWAARSGRPEAIYDVVRLET